MKFGPLPIAEAEGAILAHSLGLETGRLKKGRALTAEDIIKLREGGVEMVTVAKLEPGDVQEDEAALRISQAIVPDPLAQNISTAAPFTGRCNLFAEQAGVLRLDADSVRALNRIDDAITFATLADNMFVTARQMLGTIKIIPYALPDTAVARAEALAGAARILAVQPVIARSARIILTRTPGMRDAVIEKGAEAIRRRLIALGISDFDEVVTAHETDALGLAMAESRADLTLVLTGSATTDRGDVGPAALSAAGGELVRVGIPVDPGNLLFLGHIQGRSVVGLPGCARSPRLNGADWVVQRLACGIAVNSDDIAAMSVGGLLKEISSRPEPRAGGARAPQRPQVAAVLLAAGASRRMLGRDKLLEPVEGTPLIRILAERLGKAADEVVCVLRPDDTARRAALEGSGARIVINPHAEDGMGTSIASGIAALGPETDAAAIVPGDMPEITGEGIARLVAAFSPEDGRAIIRATTPKGRGGHPVLFGRRFFETLCSLDGDRGARSVLEEHPEYVIDVALPGKMAETDLDTPEEWAAWRARSEQRGNVA
ncbi:MAG TPA: molybdopterin-binding/glycosyltransferase family 2 protein [Paracoccaceae bacterium]|nr:molybdopterin-binding/glycosyltransferase family 2 protein [Paracoccaceae bacterium]